MQHPERIYFEKLKDEIAVLFRQSEPDAPERMEDWSGKVLERFQSALLEKVKSSVSTKWYYTHIKGGNEQKLPRVDVLNLLSAFAGYENWEVFVLKKKEEGLLPKTETGKGEAGKETKQLTPPRTKRMGVFLLSTASVIAVIVLLMMFTDKKDTLRFCFVDSDLGGPVKDARIQVKVLWEGESPAELICDTNGCFEVELKMEKVTFIVQADYYRPDTIVRTLGKNFPVETIRLKSDDYARMIRIFSGSKVEDYEKRRSQLNKMFADDAEIIQVYPGDERGMEMFNKEEFINKLTMPISSLKNIEVIETNYDAGRIRQMRFIQKTEEK